MLRISETCTELSDKHTALQQQLHNTELELKSLLDFPPDNELDRYQRAEIYVFVMRIGCLLSLK